VLKGVGDRALKALEAHHRRKPGDVGAAIETIRTRIGVSPDVHDHVVGLLESRGQIVRSGTMLRQANFIPAAAIAHQALRELLLARLCETGAYAPPIRDLVREFGGAVPQVLGDLEREGLVVSLADGLFATSHAASALRDQVSANLDRERGYRPTELRAIFGMSRRHLLPWLEYFDRVGFSKREGDLRRFRR
jgi:selenocysteine-specific elongation factor